MPNSFKKFVRFFSVSDLFKYKFYFRIGTTIENSTFFSIFISLLVITPLLVYFFLIAKNTLVHSSAKINVQEFDVNKRPFMSFNKDNFRLAFRIIQSNNMVFSGDIADYFDFSISYGRVVQSKSNFSYDYMQLFEIEEQ